ncbi:MAG: hypothetical protein ACW9W4_01065 [Candidatus Nitrosopumilus sp. bin_7KS]
MKTKFLIIISAIIAFAIISFAMPNLSKVYGSCEMVQAGTLQFAIGYQYTNGLLYIDNAECTWKLFGVIPIVSLLSEGINFQNFSIFQFVHADCNVNTDWLDAPCFDMWPVPKSEVKSAWEQYYNYKGTEWMEIKKSEMNYALDKGILYEWIYHGSQFGNQENYNVYFYYFINDEAPAIGDYPESMFKKEDGVPNAPRYSDSNKDSFEVIITYYYISVGGLLVLLPVLASVGVVAFLIYRRIGK